MAISRHFIKPVEYTHTTSGTIFIADVWISGQVILTHYKTWRIPLGVFASKN